MSELVDKYTIDGKIVVNYTDEQGIFASATKRLESKEKSFGIPGRAIMHAFDEFPFKETVIDILSEIPETKNSLNPKRGDFYISTVLLTTQLLVNVNVDRETLDEKFPKYQNLPLFVED